MSCTNCKTSTTSKCGCTSKVDPCLEACGCKYEVESLACVRHNGNDLPCIEVVKGDTLEIIITKINSKICDLVTGLDGEDGIDGTSVNHVSFLPDFVGEIAGTPGQTDTYTVWGDVAETINLGTYQVHNGINGTGIHHTSFTSTDGTNLAAGTPGQTDTYTVWGDAVEAVNLGTFVVHNGADGVDYDSGWVAMNDYNVPENFGLAPYSAGWEHPKLRVLGKTVFLEGYVLIPLAHNAGGGSVLLDDASTYRTTYRNLNDVYSAVSGGFDQIIDSTLRSKCPMMPQALTPTLRHLVNDFQLSYRNVLDANMSVNVTLTSVFPTTYINTDGTLEINTLKAVETQGGGGVLINSPYNMFVTKTNMVGTVPSYENYLTQHQIFTDNRVSPNSGMGYPSVFNGNISGQLGGFRIKVTTSYPLGKDITQTQIEAAITQILS